MRHEGRERRELALSVLALAGTMLVAGCSDAVTGVRATAPALSAVAPDHGLATLRWHQTARDLVLKYRANPLPVTRAFALLSMSQYAAVRGSIDGGGRRDYEAERGAVAGASAVVLAHIFPGERDFLDEIVRSQGKEGPGAVHPFFSRGEITGRAVAGEQIERARTDGFDAVWTGTIPTGVGLWFSTGAAPAMPLLGAVRPNYLTSGSQFRPGPPPALGSAEFSAALTEVRHISNTRTAEQLRIARQWGLSTGSITTQGYWNVRAAGLIEAAGLDELQAARVMSLLNAAAMDAMIGCWDAKYTYWFLRPSHADAGITLPIGLPSHPSYPSGHSCISGASATVLGAIFPPNAEQLHAEVLEAGRSRVYGGIHYQFDCDAGRVLGENVARFAMDVEAASAVIVDSSR